jgi:hypothetical protein
MPSIVVTHCPPESVITPQQKFHVAKLTILVEKDRITNLFSLEDGLDPVLPKEAISRIGLQTTERKNLSTWRSQRSAYIPCTR